MTTLAGREEQAAPASIVASQLSIGVQKVVLRFRAADATTVIRVSHPRVNFLVSDELEASCEVQCVSGPLPSDAAQPPEGESVRREWIDDASGTTHVLFYGRRRSKVMEAYLYAVIDPDFRRVTAVQAPEQPGDPIFELGYPLDEYLIGRLLCRAGALLVHACALVKDGHALVFVGHSGAGKSTMAEIGERDGALVLSDDRTILDLQGEEFFAWGTPWHGSYRRGTAGAAKLRALFLLEQAPTNRVDPIGASRAFGELFVRLIQPTSYAPELLPPLRTLASLVTAVPMAVLEFVPTEEAYRLACAF